MDWFARALVLTFLACCSANGAVKKEWQTAINEEYGFAVRFPADHRVCRSLSGSHPHGFHTYLNSDCSRITSKKSRVRSLSIWADYNTADWDLSDLERLSCDHPRYRSELVKAVPSIAGLASRYCFLDMGEGQLTLNVLTERGSAAKTFNDPTLKGGYVNYRATLTTTREHLRQDYHIFRRFAESVSLRELKNQ